MDNLSRCPFCGAAAQQWEHRIESSGDSCPVFHVGCRNEACAIKPQAYIAGQWGYPQKGDPTNGQAQAKAITDWNRRFATDKREAELLARIQELEAQAARSAQLIVKAMGLLDGSHR